MLQQEEKLTWKESMESRNNDELTIWVGKPCDEM